MRCYVVTEGAHLATADPPADDPNDGVAGRGLGDQRSATVSLAGILPRLARTDHVVGDLPPAVVGLADAVAVGHGGEADLLQGAGLAAPGAQGPPA